MKPLDSPFTLAPIVVLVGPTAIGKTALSLALAEKFDFEIISVDSMQVYRYMDIGTAKITQKEMRGIPHHLIDVADPDEPFNAGLFEKLALRAVQDILSRDKKILITGGTGLYLRALLSGLSQKLPSYPAIRKELEGELVAKGHKALHEELTVIDRISAERIHKNDTGRLIRALEIYRGTGATWSSLLENHKQETTERFPNVLHIGLTCERKNLYEQINKRCHIMLEQGLQKEVESLLSQGYDEGLKSMQSIGYKHMVKHLKGEWDYSTMTDNLIRDTRRYAKRQYTWFNAVEEMHWHEKTETNMITPLIGDFFKGATSTR